MTLFLADESCDFAVVRRLRELHFDVEYIAETSPGIPDAQVLTKATENPRILITEDRDFCELVFRDQEPTFGIILIRISDRERSRKIEQLELLAIKFADNLPHTVTTVTNNRMRYRSLFA